MNEILNSVLPAAVGFGLGLAFFGGLWWTVRIAMQSRQPAVWFLGSQLVRTGLVLIGFYLVSGGQWQPMLIALAGFLVARVVVIRRSAQFDRGPATEYPVISRSIAGKKGEAHHAS